MDGIVDDTATANNENRRAGMFVLCQSATMTPIPSTLLSALAAAAERADASTDWPAASWRRLGDAGVLAWSVPAAHGGAGWSAVQLLAAYEQLAGACLTTAFILSQREAAVRRLIASNTALAGEMLPGLARGERFATVGLSQLTTSRQHQGTPALRATMDADGFHLDGLIPWVTAADRTDLLVIGATLADGRQVLLGLPPRQAGVTLGPPLDLMALAGSRTCEVYCGGVTLPRQALLAGPAEKILSGKPGGVGGLETSCVALGHAGAGIDYLRQEAGRRPDLVAIAERFERVRAHLRSHLHTLAQRTPAPEEMVALRVDCTQLALQASQVALTVAKGAGFVAPHPAQRWARQALFFLVWSCPRPAAEGLIGHLLPEEPPG
jgi:alkylation response protein AidB-like acyl-CoA dehydrogenase